LAEIEAGDLLEKKEENKLFLKTNVFPSGKKATARKTHWRGGQ